MSQENVEVVRSIFAAWERGDFSSAEWAHPEIEFAFADGPLPGSWTGLNGMAESMRAFLSTWEEWRIEADDYRELDEERVFVLSHFTGRGKASGLDVGQTRAKGAHLFHLRGGRVTRLVAYMDRDQALEAAGLSE
jgi:ketosteroid isomerase-like protein